MSNTEKTKKITNVFADRYKNQSIIGAMEDIKDSLKKHPISCYWYFRAYLKSSTF